MLRIVHLKKAFTTERGEVKEVRDVDFGRQGNLTTSRRRSILSRLLGSAV